MKHKFTAVYQKNEEWWVAWVEELPGANSQGKTLEEARNNIQDAITLLLDNEKDWFIVSEKITLLFTK